MGCPVFLILPLFFFFFSFFPLPASSQVRVNNTNFPKPGNFTTSYNYPITAPLGSTWSLSQANVGNATDGWLLLPVLVFPNTGPSFACGIICRTSSHTNPCRSARFGVFLLVVNGSSSNIRTDVGQPILVWSANRNISVQGNATLRFTTEGDLRLEDSQGFIIWSTGTSAAHVAGMNLTISGNLLLYGRRNRVVWQSYDHPTDTALPGQSLAGKQLVANLSADDTSDGRFLLSVYSTSYSAYVRADPSSQLQIYYTSGPTITAGELVPWVDTDPDFDRAKKFVRLEANGHLTRYEWSTEAVAWTAEESLTEDYREVCSYPTVCSRYGLCTGGECSCPRTVDKNESFFEPMQYERPREGCRERVLLYCLPENQRLHRLLDYGDIAFYGYAGPGDIIHTDVENCKTACLRNCSCRGAFFKYGQSKSIGDCYLPSTILSLTDNNSTQSGYKSSAFFKIQIESAASNASSRSWRLIVELTLGVLCALVLVGICTLFVLLRRNSRRHRQQEDAKEQEMEGFDFTHLPGMPTRFTYEELRSATDDFSTKLGEGGFGAVFRGTLSGGTSIAVKLLGYKGQGMKEFLAEVETIGSIHHVNLVRLAGYCAERFHRLLVYEFLSNGSLDKWIFRDPPILDWPTKYKIILDVAKGLSYLHEDCRNRIIHLDIKPQNILLDDAFNAKISDFGLSKLIEKDQSQVVTTLRGTPGYIAPEWLTSTITEKVDVYSFGIVVLETVTGKRILDSSRSQGSMSLLSLLKKAAGEDRLLDMVGGQCNGEEAMTMLRVAMWCLQVDYNNRPSMAAVVKVLERVMDVEVELDHNFWVPTAVVMPSRVPSTSGCSTPLLPSLVSGPRILVHSNASLSDKLPGDVDIALGEALMAPTVIYVRKVLDIISKGGVKGIAHITGGGFTDNIPRVFPAGLGARIFRDSWEIPALFKWMQEVGGIEDAEMRRTFNMGIGMVLVVSPEASQRILTESHGKDPAYCIGEVIVGDGVTFT